MLPIKLNVNSDFLEPSESCNYEILESVKEIWAIELDLLNEIMKVCEQFNITYYAIGGTLLGCVRHKGFIPWDDDIDIAMDRNEYNRFCEIAEKGVFSYPYFFQNENTDPGFGRGFSRLRNSKTTAILQNELVCNIKLNQGIFVDIFPLDHIPDELAERKKYVNKVSALQKKMRRFYRLTLGWNNSGEAVKNKAIKHIIGPVLKKVCEAFRIHNIFYAKFEREVQKYKDISTKEIGIMHFYNQKETVIWPRSKFEKNDQMSFEMLNISVPSEYEDILTKQYGNWHVFVKGSSTHGKTFFDPKNPFTNYLS